MPLATGSAAGDGNGVGDGTERVSRSSRSSSARSYADIPRYLPLPDCLYKLRRRFPAVTQCVLLECLRCRQWVPVEVLDAIPNEVETVRVCLQATEKREKAAMPPFSTTLPSSLSSSSSSSSFSSTSSSLSAVHSYYPTTAVTQAGASERRGGNASAAVSLCFSEDPRVRVHKYLSDAEQARARMFMEAKRKFLGVSPAGRCSADSDVTQAWHSPRLREHQRRESGDGSATVATPPHANPLTDKYGCVLVSMAEQNFGASVLHGNTGSLAEYKQSGVSASTALSLSSSSSLERPQSGGLTVGKLRKNTAATATPLYIPNPAVFICPWQCCEQADILLDLRTDCLGELYAAAVKAKVVSPLPRGGDAALPPACAKGAGVAETARTFEDACRVSAHLWSKRHALNELLAKELDLRKSGRLAKRRGNGGPDGRDAAAGAFGKLVSRVLDSSGSDDAEENSSSGGDYAGSPTTPAGAQRLQAKFLKAAAQAVLQAGAANAESEGRERRGNHRGGDSGQQQQPALSLSAMGTEEARMQAERRVLSAFCWVTCDSCGKLRRLTQPFPGGCGAPFVCPLAASIGACDVPEGEGIVSATAQFAARAEELAILYLASSQLPEPLATRAAAALHGSPDRRAGDGGSGRSAPWADDPLLKLVHSDAARRAFRYGAEMFPSSPTSSSSPRALPTGRQKSSKPPASALLAQDLVPEAFPVLKQVAAIVKKRSLGAFIRKLCLTPQEIRQKREEVLRAYLYEEKNEQDEGGGEEQQEIEQSEALPKRHSSLSPRAEEASSVVDVNASDGVSQRRKASHSNRTRHSDETVAKVPVATSREANVSHPRRHSSREERPKGKRTPTSASTRASKLPARGARKGGNSVPVSSSSASSSGGSDADSDAGESEEETETSVNTSGSNSIDSADDDQESEGSEEEDDEEAQAEHGSRAAPRKQRQRSAQNKKTTASPRQRSSRSSPPARRRARVDAQEAAGTASRASSSLTRKRVSLASPMASAVKPSTTAKGTKAPQEKQNLTHAEAAAPVRRKRGRPPGHARAVKGDRQRAAHGSHGHHTDTGIDDGEGDSNHSSSSSRGSQQETVFWVQCDLCDKWRILPKKLPLPVEFWECKMRPGTTCNDVDDEEKMSSL